jgi:glycosyltransferase involved in cell wall biosynthesis
MTTPLVSVCLITYNHEKYIRQAIEGVLMQKLTFDWEFIIADDYSTDGTRAILTEYQEKYPERIKLIFQEKNVGPAKNWLDLITAPQSKYIAYFEGDDYWTDENKLQKQVDFLEKNPNFTLCHSDVNVLTVDGTVIDNHSLKSWNYKKDVLDYRLAIFVPLAFSCTSVFRNTLPVKKLSTNVKAGDWMIWVLLTLQGDAKFLKEKQAVYRQGTGVSVSSVWHKNFNQRAFFLLKLVSVNYSFDKNKWLVKGALYYLIYWVSVTFKINRINYFSQKLKFQLS